MRFIKKQKLPDIKIKRRKFELSKSLLDARQLADLKKTIRQRIEDQRDKESIDTTFTPPRYDEAYWEGMALLDKEINSISYG